MGDCFLSYRATYTRAMAMNDNSGEHKGCGETLNASWKFAKDQKGNYYVRIESPQLPELLNIEKEFKLFKVLELSEDQLTLQFSHKQFSDKITTITDILVPENTSIKDREFHW